MNCGDDHRKLVNEKINAEDEAVRSEILAVRRAMQQYLGSLGYQPAEIEADKVFEIRAGNISETVSTDFILSLKGRSYMAIKCVASSVESWERCMVAFARVADTCQIPYALVTDGEFSRLIETSTGNVVAGELNSLPTRDEAEIHIEKLKPVSCPTERKEREMRILLAYNSISLTPEEPERLKE